MIIIWVRVLLEKCIDYNRPICGFRKGFWFNKPEEIFGSTKWMSHRPSDTRLLTNIYIYIRECNGKCQDIGKQMHRKWFFIRFHFSVFNDLISDSTGINVDIETPTSSLLYCFCFVNNKQYRESMLDMSNDAMKSTAEYVYLGRHSVNSSINWDEILEKKNLQPMHFVSSQWMELGALHWRRRI